jgi:hypothetical protein
MTKTQHNLKLNDPGELLETLPYLIGFHPEASVVLVGLDQGRVTVTARLDISAARRGIEVDSSVHVLLQAAASAAIVAIFAAPDDVTMGLVPSSVPLPHGEVVADIRAALQHHDIDPIDFLFVQDGRWWCYDGRAMGCPECQGGTELPGDAAVGPASAVFAGLQALPNRDALTAVLEPDHDAIRERHRPGIEALQRSLARGRLDPRVERERRSVKRALFAAARDSDQALFPQPTVNLSSAKVGRFAVGLADIEIRDALWLAIDQHRLDGRGLWLLLSQRLPAPYDSAPLFLFGWASWRAGSGTLASIAAERALASRPGYTAAELLLSAVQTGLDPFRTPKLRRP